MIYNVNNVLQSFLHCKKVYNNLKIDRQQGKCSSGEKKKLRELIQKYKEEYDQEIKDLGGKTTTEGIESTIYYRNSTLCKIPRFHLIFW